MSPPPLTDELTRLAAARQRRAMRREVGWFVFGALVMGVGALLWARVVVECERAKPGESATCVVTHKRLFGLVPFTSFTEFGVARATHDVIPGYSSPSQPRPSAPSYMLVLQGRALHRPVESGPMEFVGAAEAQLNALLLTPAPGRASAGITVWVPSVFALVGGLLPAFAGGQRAWQRLKGIDPDARRSRRAR